MNMTEQTDIRQTDVRQKHRLMQRVKSHSCMYSAKQRQHLFSTALTMSQFNGMDCLVQGLGRAYKGRTFTCAREQFRPDALPATTTDSHGYYRWESNPGSLGAWPLLLTADPLQITKTYEFTSHFEVKDSAKPTKTGRKVAHRILSRNSCGSWNQVRLGQAESTFTTEPRLLLPL